MAPDSPINPRTLADLQRSCYLPLPMPARVTDGWNTALPIPAVEHICLLGTVLYAVSANGVAGLDARDGSLLWRRDRQNNACSDVDAVGLLTYSGAVVSRIGPDGKPRGRQTLRTAGESYLHFFAQRDRDVVYGYQSLPSPSDQPGDAGTPLSFSFKRDVAGEPFSSMRLSIEGVISGIAARQDLSMVYVAGEGALASFDPASGRDPVVSTSPVSGLVSFALLSDGLPVVVLHRNEGAFMEKLDAKGAVAWSVPIPAVGPAGIGLACTPAGFVFYCGRGQLVCVRDGAIVWTADLDLVSPAAHVTACLNGDVIVAVANSLRAFTSAGSSAWEHAMPFAITCRPVIDGTGRIYVAGAGAVACLF